MNQFKQRMSNLSNDELLTILNVKRHDYVEEAIKAVEDILDERGVIYEKKTEEQFAKEDELKTSFVEKIYVPGSWQRFFEYLIDYVASFVVALLFHIYTLGLFNSFVFGFVLSWAYYTIMEATSGKTIGKMVLGMTVVDKDGNKPSVQRIMLRSLCRFIPFDAFSFLGEGFVKHELRGCWHDSISRTYVVKEKKLKALKQSLSA